MPKIFISSTSQDLRSYRAVVTEWAKANGHEAVVMDEFPVASDHTTIVQLLREQLDPCDAIIHLAGLYYGFEPTNRPDGVPRRSYTQLELGLAKDHGRQVFRFIARPGYEPDNEYSQSEEEADLQRQHRSRLMDGDKPFHEFTSHDELRSLLCRIDIKSTLRKPQNLPVVGSLFKGRDDFIEQLRSVLVNKPTHSAAVTAKQAIHGLGGVGKTRVAVEYARQFQHDYTALLFVTADSPANLDRNLANLCGALVLNLPEQQEPKQELQVAAAVRWLRENSGWLLIVDNVDTPEAAEATEELLKRLNTGHVVVTSRLSEWGHALEELSLDVITEIAATEFLLERTNLKRKPEPTDYDHALSLAKDLGQLPLALEQAGAFIVKHRGGFHDYHIRWKTQEAKVLEWHDKRTMKYPASVATTWQTSFDLLSEDGRSLLNVLCWLAPDPIPLKMVQSLSAFEGEDTIDIENGIANLADYSLVKWSGKGLNCVVVHRLVEEITRYRLPLAESPLWVKRALHMVNTFVDTSPEDLESWKTIYTPCGSHIKAVSHHADLHRISAPTTRLMSSLARYYNRRGEFAEAEPLMRRTLSIDEENADAVPRELAISVSDLGQLLAKTNRPKEAEPLLRRALSINEKHYGRDHSEIVNDLNRLGGLYYDTNRMEEAERLYRRALRIEEHCPAPDGLSATTTQNNLALLLQATNRHREAEPLIRLALKIQEQDTGSNDPEVAVMLNNLAALLMDTNRLAEAEPHLRRALKIDEESYGADHPAVGRDLNNLAELLRKLQRPHEAEGYLRRALSIDEHIYGLQHPNVAVRLNNLAQLLEDSGDPGQAEPLMRRALCIDVDSYGTSHPAVARDLNNLGWLLKSVRQFAEAESLMRRAISIDESCLGEHHPDVARDLNNLAMLLKETNRVAESQVHLWRVVEILVAFERDSGYEHPNLRFALANYISVLTSAGLSEEEAIARIEAKLRGDA